jgi:NhaP-type Na+/H+ or K+/H+ antiporter
MKKRRSFSHPYGGYLAMHGCWFARWTSWSSAAGERLAVLVLPVLTDLTATALGGNGFVTAFVAALPPAPWAEERSR